MNSQKRQMKNNSGQKQLQKLKKKQKKPKTAN